MSKFKKQQPKAISILPASEKAIEMKDVSRKAELYLHDFKIHLELLRVAASHMTHYDRLSAWSDPVYAFIRERLKEFGFVNGDVKANENKPDVQFWWEIYGIISSIIYSQALVTDVAHHHSSAFERNEALIFEISEVILRRPISLPVSG